VVHAEDYRYLCSDPGQNLIKEAIREHKLSGVVVAACSPKMHETTFRRAVTASGLNPYLCECANIREQCSWVHEDPVEATRKAGDLVRMMVEKVKYNHPLEPIRVPLTKRALVIGGGIAGIQAALDIADGGREVILVERSPSIGGHMAQLSETFPTLDCSQCILTPKMVEVAEHPNIRLYTYSEVEAIGGTVGQFKVRIKKKPRYVDPDLCTACGDCASACPVSVPNEYDMGMSSRKGIYIPFPQAVPAVYTLDPEACLGLFPLACDKCRQACEPKAINYDMRPEYVTEEVGAVVVATGYDLYSMDHLGEYGYDTYADVIDGLFFERLLSASGPTGGVVRRPSDHRVPQEVVFVQCAGSREPERHKAYCSKICCMYTAKQAMLYQHKVPGGQAYIFYIDVRTAGRDYEEFYHRALDEGVIYIRGKVSRIFQENGKIVVRGADTIAGMPIELKADMVVLATPMEPSAGVKKLLSELKLSVTPEGWVREAHPKLRPVESVTQGFYLAGCAQGPKDIQESVAQGSAAASKVLALFSSDELKRDPTIARVNESSCIGCFSCERVCPYGAIERREIRDREGNLVRVVAGVIESLCQGCGLCAAVCPSSSIDVQGITEEQVHAQIVAI
jgi:heterodisulfide reductase subunit A